MKESDWIQDYLSQEEVDNLLRGVDPDPPRPYQSIYETQLFGKKLVVLEAADHVFDYIKETFTEHEDWAWGLGRLRMFVSQEVYLMVALKF
jgi:hypothetical protein